MKLVKDESGAVFLEAAVVIPLLMVVMLLFVFLLNLFIVHSVVQYGLNQTVNELGNYTYFLEYAGVVDWSNDMNAQTAETREEFKRDFDMVTEAYTNVTAAVSSGSEVVNNVKNADVSSLSLDDIKTIVEGVKKTGNDAKTAAGSVKNVWEKVKVYIEDPSKLVGMLKDLLKSEIKDSVHSLLGGLLGKLMMGRYTSETFLTGCGVVSTNYNGKMSSSEYITGIKGMDFSKSSFLGDDNSRIIDIVVVYRVKFPFNVSFMAGGDEDSALYKNSMLIVQRAGGYGWTNGDDKGKSEYNGRELFDDGE